MKETNIENIGRILNTENTKWFIYSIFFEGRIDAVGFLEKIKKVGLLRVLKNNGLYKQTGARHTTKIFIDEKIERFITLSQNAKQYAEAIIAPTKDDVTIFLTPITYSRDEEAYLGLLEKMLDGICKIERQFIVLDYRIDMYIPELKIAIEFDESYHSKNKEKDIERQLKIEVELDCVFYRIDETKDIMAQINDILKYISKKITGSYIEFNGRFITESCLDTLLPFIKDFDLYFQSRNMAAINKSTVGILSKYEKIKIQNIEEKMAFAIDMGYITSFDMLLAELRKLWLSESKMQDSISITTTNQP